MSSASGARRNLARPCARLIIPIVWVGVEEYSGVGVWVSSGSGVSVSTSSGVSVSSGSGVCVSGTGVLVCSGVGVLVLGRCGSLYRCEGKGFREFRCWCFRKGFCGHHGRRLGGFRTHLDADQFTTRNGAMIVFAAEYLFSGIVGAEAVVTFRQGEDGHAVAVGGLTVAAVGSSVEGIHHSRMRLHRRRSIPSLQPGW